MRKYYVWGQEKDSYETRSYGNYITFDKLSEVEEFCNRYPNWDYLVIYGEEIKATPIQTVTKLQFLHL